MEQQLGPSYPVQRVSIARLHGLACFFCGAVACELVAAGTITLPGRKRSWPIVTCGCTPAATGTARPHFDPGDRSHGPGDGQRYEGASTCSTVPPRHSRPQAT